MDRDTWASISINKIFTTMKNDKNGKRREVIYFKVSDNDDLNKVKKVVMEWIENVEEARMYVEETMKDQVDTEEIGAQMDAEKEHEDLFCQEEGCEDDPVYLHLNPEELLEQNCFDSLGPKFCKRLNLRIIRYWRKNLAWRGCNPVYFELI